MLHSYVSLLRGVSLRRDLGEGRTGGTGAQVLPSLVAASVAEVSLGMLGVLQLEVR